MRRTTRIIGVCLLVLAGLALSPFGPPGTALADHADVTVCDEASFDAALDAVQTSGGGSIVIDCFENISITSPKVITTDVSIWRGTFHGGDSSRLFEIESGASLTVYNSSLEHGSADFGAAVLNNGEFNFFSGYIGLNSSTSSGGAIRNFGTMTIVGSSFEGNTSGEDGGAILNASGATATMNFVHFTGNTAGDNGGAIRNAGQLDVEYSQLNGNEAQSGGGGAITNNDSGTLTVLASSFASNTADAHGGAIRNGGTLDVTASTIAENSAGGQGGGIRNGGSLTILSSTIVGNGADASGGNLRNVSSASIASSIVANASSSSNCSGGIVSNGYNLSDDSSCGFASTGDLQNSVAINLAPLDGVSRPTELMVPQAGSDALDTASCAVASEFDQLHAPRPEVDCDKGAVEVGATIQVLVYSFVPAIGPMSEGSTNQGWATSFLAPEQWSILFDCANDSTFDDELPCPAFPDDGFYTVGVQVCDDTDPTNCDTATFDVEVLNVDPVINSITTNGPVAPGQPVQVTVNATDQGPLDVLSYSFDCDNDTVYEVGPQASNVAQCTVDTNLSPATIGVMVTDDDGGEATDVVQVGIQATLCASYYTGAVSAPSGSAGCPAGTMLLTLPSPSPTTFCISSYTGAITWSPRGTCNSVSLAHVVPDDGPLNYCRSLWTGKLRYDRTGTCKPNEVPGVIPGSTELR